MQCLPRVLHWSFVNWIMALSTVLLYYYLLLVGDYHVVSGFTLVTYSAQSSTAECGQTDPPQMAMHVVDGSHQSGPSAIRSSRMQPSTKQILSEDSPTASHQLPQATTRYVFTSISLLWHKGDQLWSTRRLEESCLSQY